MNKRMSVLLLILGSILIAYGIYAFTRNDDEKSPKTESVEETNTESIDETSTDTTEESTSETDGEISETDNEDKSSDLSDTPDQVETDPEAISSDFYITKLTDFNTIMETNKPKLIMFGASWCQYCKQMRPYVEKISNERADEIIIKYVDAEKNPEISMNYPVQSVPAMMYYHSDGSSYYPDEKYHKYGFYGYATEGSDETTLTMSFGLLEENIFTEIVEDMLSNDR